MVNARLKAPKAPGWWVDSCRCQGCCATYADSHYGVTWEDGAQLVRSQYNAENDDDSGGFRSRGPVLWAMRVTKLYRWYADHHGCREGAERERDYREWAAFVDEAAADEYAAAAK